MSKQHSSKNKAWSDPEDALTRRSFARVAIGGVGLCYAAAVGYPVYRYLKSPVEKEAQTAAVTEVTVKDAQKMPVGAAMRVTFGIEPCLLIRSAQDKWVALSAKCTHLGCTVAYEADKKRIFCACHGGTYDPETGKNVSGPPPRPLKSFVIKDVNETAVVVSRI
jgi:cytochrome b6-f complex iron-sulfur subunit